MARLSTRTKKKIAHKSREILEKEPHKELSNRQLLFKLDEHGFKNTLIYPESLYRIINEYAPCIGVERRKQSKGLVHTDVVYYKLKR